MDRICLNRLLLITATRNSTGPYLEGEDDGVSTAAFTNKSSGLTERTVLHMAQTLSDHSPRIVKPWKLFGGASSAFLCVFIGNQELKGNLKVPMCEILISWILMKSL
jgi:hypothetical protein